jgi:hypothetical protein
MIELFKEPGAVFAVSAFVTIAFIFIESRMTKSKKPWRYYIKCALFVGGLSSFFVYVNHKSSGSFMFKFKGLGGTSPSSQSAFGDSLFLESFPN